MARYLVIDNIFYPIQMTTGLWMLLGLNNKLFQNDKSHLQPALKQMPDFVSGCGKSVVVEESQSRYPVIRAGLTNRQSNHRLTGACLLGTSQQRVLQLLFGEIENSIRR